MFPNRSHAPIGSVMSTKHVRTVADLVRFGCGVRIACDGCGSAATFDGYQLGQKVGAGVLATVQRRLKCHRCGSKSARLTVLPPV